jgi:hypothetical protein
LAPPPGITMSVSPRRTEYIRHPGPKHSRISQTPQQTVPSA